MNRPTYVDQYGRRVDPDGNVLNGKKTSKTVPGAEEKSSSETSAVDEYQSQEPENFKTSISQFTVPNLRKAAEILGVDLEGAGNKDDIVARFDEQGATVDDVREALGEST